MGRSRSTCDGHWHRPHLYSPVPTWAAQFDKPALPLLYAIQLWAEFFLLGRSSFFLLIHRRSLYNLNANYLLIIYIIMIICYIYSP